MAIAGFLVLVEQGRLEETSFALACVDCLTVQDAGDGQHLVVVAESPSGSMGALEGRIKAVDGVLSAATAYLNIEDELACAAPGRATA